MNLDASDHHYRPPISSRIVRWTRFGGNCSCKQCARKACVGNGREQQHRGRRETSPKQEYLSVRMCVCASAEENCCIQRHQLPVTVVLIQRIMADMNDRHE
jgi:hypothetical protein